MRVGPTPRLRVAVLVVTSACNLRCAYCLQDRHPVRRMSEETAEPPKVLILDMGATDQLDVTSAGLLTGFTKQLLGKGIVVCLAEVHRPVLEDARRTGLLEVVGEDHVFPTVDAAVNHIEAEAAGFS